MKRVLVAIALTSAILACTKTGPETTPSEPEVSSSDIEALRKDIEELKTKVANLTPSDPSQGISVAEFEALKADFEAVKTENGELKAQVELLSSGFFEVDGLRFDKNGTLISVPKLEKEVVVKNQYNVSLTTTRTYDAEGRVIDIKRSYSGYNSMTSLPYYWQEELYEYNGKTCKTTVRTNKYGLPAGTPYEEEITETKYW